MDDEFYYILKTAVDSVFSRSLIGCSISEYPALVYTHSVILVI